MTLKRLENIDLCLLIFTEIMEDLGFFPYPSSFSTGFADEILDPGPTSFFLKGMEYTRIFVIHLISYMYLYPMIGKN